MMNDDEWAHLLKQDGVRGFWDARREGELPEISPAMIEAGIEAYAPLALAEASMGQIVEAIFYAMVRARQ